jgi:hypothetical protein
MPIRAEEMVKLSNIVTCISFWKSITTVLSVTLGANELIRLG